MPLSNPLSNPGSNPYSGHVRPDPGYPDCDSDTDDTFMEPVRMLMSIDDPDDLQTVWVAGRYRWSDPDPRDRDVCGSRQPLHPALHALRQQLAKAPAVAGDCTPQVFGDAVEALRALRTAATPPARSNMTPIIHGSTAGIGRIMLAWAGSDVARARLVEALKASSQEDVADVVAAAFVSAMRDGVEHQGSARFEGIRAVLRDIRPDADAVTRSLDRVEGRGDDGRLRRPPGDHAARSWRSSFGRYPAICQMMADEIRLPRFMS
ncbi:hypothetical protein [Mitsuaria sp. 7]|uniref:hypothetical protein n=1 Tax=Mitsuaria sp. 7 TaxID=1658665 RepID=UPI0007DD38AB|nr:hypothetical protein [Mitsuaria sp. 7]ANH69450.1 hypothetical protein ABE85_21110 [Mitsuaria sp. 7]